MVQAVEEDSSLRVPAIVDAPTEQLTAPSDMTIPNLAASRPLLSIAPMMEWTDVHYRQLARLLSRRTWLWTEMVVDKTVLHTQLLDKYLWFPPEQRPLVLQLGGSDPALLAAAAARAAQYGYDEINLNCGCPSDRVAGAGCFGAALMLQPQLVAQCMAAMAAAVAEVTNTAPSPSSPAAGGPSSSPAPPSSPSSPAAAATAGAAASPGFPPPEHDAADGLAAGCALSGPSPGAAKASPLAAGADAVGPAAGQGLQQRQPQQQSGGPSPPPSGGLPRPAVTVKCRLGVDEADSYERLREFVRVVSEESPVRHFVVHARKAFLNGLSPHQNRTVPPLRHQWAWALARDFPHLQFSLNGGVLSCHEARSAILAAHPEVPYSRPEWPAGHPFAAAAAVCGIPPAPERPSGLTASGEPVAGGLEGNGRCDGAEGAICPGGRPGNGHLASQPLQSQEESQSTEGWSGTERTTTTEVSSWSRVTTGAPGGWTNGGGIEGVMVGRAAYNDPWGCLADADRAVYGEPMNAAPSRRWVIERYLEYAEPMLGRWFVKADGHRDPSVRTLMRPLLNLFHGEPGCKRWKNAVDEVLRTGQPATVGEVLDRTLHLIPDAVLDAPPRQPDLAALPPFPLDPLLPAPASRAGHNQGPPGSKPPRGGTQKSGAAAAGTDDAGQVEEEKDGEGGREAGGAAAEGAGLEQEAAASSGGGINEGHGAGGEGVSTGVCCSEAAAARQNVVAGTGESGDEVTSTCDASCGAAADAAGRASSAGGDIPRALSVGVGSELTGPVAGVEEERRSGHGSGSVALSGPPVAVATGGSGAEGSECLSGTQSGGSKGGDVVGEPKQGQGHRGCVIC